MGTWIIDGRVIAQAMWLGLAIGALAFPHCLGMCGGFALYLARPGARASVIQRQTLWHAGRLLSYIFLGSLAGFAGRTLLGSAPAAGVQKGVAWVAGGIIALLGLALMGYRPQAGRPAAGWLAGRAGDVLAPLLKRLAEPPTRSGAFLLGVGTGWLPCPVVLAGLTLVVPTASVPAGMALMAGLGLGTLWSLLLLGSLGHALGVRLRRWSATLAGVVLVLLGVATALRGTAAFHRWLGCPAIAAAPAPCCALQGAAPGVPDAPLHPPPPEPP